MRDRKFPIIIVISILIVILLILVVAGSLVFFSLEDKTGEELNSINEQNIEGGLNQNNEVEETSGDNCDLFPDKLAVCEPYTCEFEHILSGELIKREIEGIFNDTCGFTEHPSEFVEISCFFLMEKSEEYSNFYRESTSTQSIASNVSNNDGDKQVSNTLGSWEIDSIRERMDSKEIECAGLFLAE